MNNISLEDWLDFINPFSYHNRLNHFSYLLIKNMFYYKTIDNSEIIEIDGDNILKLDLDNILYIICSQDREYSSLQKINVYTANNIWYNIECLVKNNILEYMTVEEKLSTIDEINYVQYYCYDGNYYSLSCDGLMNIFDEELEVTEEVIEELTSGKYSNISLTKLLLETILFCDKICYGFDIIFNDETVYEYRKEE